jgi:hypothetical protein
MFGWLRISLVPLSAFAVGIAAVSLIGGATLMGAEGREAPLFETDVRPILREYCLDCHGATDHPEGSLDLRLVRFMVTGGDAGAAIVPGDADNSHLLDRIVSGEMPPGEGKVAAEKVAIIRDWINAGAPTKRPEPEMIAAGIPITEEERAYWAYQPVQAPAAVGSDAPDERIRTPLDAIIAAAMPKGLSFSPDADRRTQIQRVFYSLIGLPPTVEEMQHWLEKPDTDWYEQLVDTLLRSPHYGERWARHWLDAAGYADSDGSTLADSDRAWAWRFRDYVIRAFNDDKPFDRFIIEQLAGDELAGPAQGDWTAEQIELLTATGFLRMAADGTGSGDNSPEARNKTIADTMQIVGSTLLASSLHCAQCHDHRYDPISHRDYFAIRAVFEPALDWQQWKTPGERLVSLTTAAERQLSAEIEAEAQRIAAERNAKQDEYMKQALEQELGKYEEPLRTQLRDAYQTAADKRTDEQKMLLDKHPSVNISPGVLYQYLPQAAEELKGFDARIGEVRAKKPAETFVHALVEPAGHLPTTRLFHRGDHNQPTEEIKPAGLSVTAAEGAQLEFPSDDPTLPTSGRRLAFARWLTDRENPHPLFTRAVVNRVWLHHFGRGIVGTPGDFGRLGSEPTHPKVLDLLADYWIANGWSLKQLHRLILTSTVFRQASVREPEREAIDPDNFYYWRKPLLRMDAEVLRDSILAISGELNAELFGPPIPIQEDETGQVSIDPGQPRRSVYARWRRTQPVAMLQSFDAPVMSINCDVRPMSTVATQSLMMMNGEFALTQAQKIAKRAVSLAGSLPQGNVAMELSLPSAPAPLWQYGTGEVELESGKVKTFIKLAHYTGSQWQGGEQVPDATIGWVLLHAQGGHPGNTSYPTIRRWTAPFAGEVTLTGTLGHGSENGDGVRARVIVSQGASGASQVVGQWQVKHGTTVTDSPTFTVECGDTVDLVVDCIANETSDSFTWPVKLAMKTTAGKSLEFDSVAGFRGPMEDQALRVEQIIAAWQLVLARAPTESELTRVSEFARQQLTAMYLDTQAVPTGASPGLQVLTNICQMLINSNEFLYID